MSKENLRTPDKIFIEDTISILERNMSDSIKITCLKIAYTNYLNREKGGQSKQIKELYQRAEHFCSAFFLHATPP